MLAPAAAGPYDSRMDRQPHWEHVYETNASVAVSWYQPSPVRSLALLDDVGMTPETRLIDVGGGDSTLVDALLARGMHRITVLDVSAAALARARTRLGARAGEVAWLEADVTTVALPEAAFDVWHDRAVFHFFTDAADRARYVAAMERAVRPGGCVVMATFALDGPARCSGLDVVRYGPEELTHALGPSFEPVRSERDVHRTPWGAAQPFTYVLLRRR